MKEPRMTPAALSALAAGDLSNACVAMTPGGIEAQEAAGQRVQASRETLPVKGTGDRRAWEALGFVFSDVTDGLFVYVEFPLGWKKVPTEHSMWTDLVDAEGKKRASIFYKAAFYDRDAFVNIDVPA